jgi:hypothetical protein
MEILGNELKSCHLEAGYQIGFMLPNGTPADLQSIVQNVLRRLRLRMNQGIQEWINAFNPDVAMSMRARGENFSLSIENCYDFVWFVGRAVPVHLSHLEQRPRQSGGWTVKRRMKQSDLVDLLEQRFSALNLAAAKKNVKPFLRDPAAVELWSKEFFQSLIPRLKFE